LSRWCVAYLDIDIDSEFEFGRCRVLRCALIAVVLLGLLALATADTDMNFIFDGLVPGSDEGSVSTTQAMDMCEIDLAKALGILNSDATAASFSTVIAMFIDAQDEYMQAAVNDSETPQMIIVDSEHDINFPTLEISDMDGLGGSGSTCAAQLILAAARLRSTGDEAKQLLIATQTYKTMTATLETKRGYPLERVVTKGALSTGCPDTTSQGFDWKIVALIATRTTNCDGSERITAKASALGYGFLDFSCVFSGPQDTCQTGSRAGISVGIASAYVYFGIIYGNGQNRGLKGIYFRPEVCYNFIVTSDCASTTIEWRW